jgi:hypothetical protein
MRLSVVFLSFFLLFLSPKSRADIPTVQDSTKIVDSVSAYVDNTPLPTNVLSLKTSWTESKYFRQSVVPVSLAATSFGILLVPDLKYEIQEQLNWNKSESVNLYDDYLRFVPTGAMALMSLCGMEGEHKILHEAALAGVSYILADFCVYRLKQATHVTRPNPAYGDESFPSQHASMAFVAATLLHREFGHVSPWISIGGYATASWVAYSRIARNRHFMTDVLLGSGIGILSTNASYWLYDAVLLKVRPNLVLTPIFTKNGAEIRLASSF